MTISFRLATVTLATAFVAFGSVGAVSGGKGPASCSHGAHCRHHAHHDHGFFHMSKPPRAPVVSSMASPQMIARPVLTMSSLRALGSPANSQIDPKVLRALASLSGESSASPGAKNSAAQTPATQRTGAAANSPANATPASPLQTPAAQAAGDVSRRLDELQRRVEANQAKIDRLLTSLEAFLERQDR